MKAHHHGGNGRGRKNGNTSRWQCGVETNPFSSSGSWGAVCSPQQVSQTEIQAVWLSPNSLNETAFFFFIIGKEKLSKSPLSSGTRPSSLFLFWACQILTFYCVHPCWVHKVHLVLNKSTRVGCACNGKAILKCFRRLSATYFPSQKMWQKGRGQSSHLTSRRVNKA